MVGIPRSTGCNICIKRRIKCDEARPSCANCIKYGATCPGYDKGLKFVVGKPHRTRRPRARSSPTSYTSSKIAASPNGSIKSFTSSPVTSITSSPPYIQKSLCHSTDTFQQIEPFQFQEPFKMELYLPPDPQPTSRELQRQEPFPELVLTIPPAIESPTSYQLQLVVSLAESLPRTAKMNEVLTMSIWLSHLPERFGNSKTLDAAIVSFTTQQIGAAFGDMQMMRAGGSTYIKALALLQKSLNDPMEAVRSETQCAAMLLCIYELFAGTTAYNSWMKHAVGLSRLMQFRGPEFMSDFDLAMLRAIRGIIVMECMFSGKKCFLAEPKWRMLVETNPDPDWDADFHMFFEEFNTLLAEMPEFLGDGWDLREANTKGEPSRFSPSEIAGLATKTMNVLFRFEEWYKLLLRRMPFPTEKASRTGDTCFPSTLTYTSGPAAGFYTNYWACIIILQEVLVACGYPPTTNNNTPGSSCIGSPSSRDLAEWICMSVEFQSEGPWTGYRIGFGLRIAYEVSSPHVQAWIRDWHVKSSATYAATSPQCLPDGGGMAKLREEHQQSMYGRPLCSAF